MKVADKEELLQVLTENGEPTGKLEKRSVVHDKGLFHMEVALFVYNSKGEVLLQRRSKNKRSNPNKLGIVAGHVVGFSSAIETVKTECSEEIGVEINEKELKLLNVEKRYNENNNNNIYQYFYVYKCDKDVSEFKIQTEELSEVIWVPFKKVEQMMLNNDSEVVFKRNSYYEKIFKLTEKEINKNNKLK